MMWFKLLYFMRLFKNTGYLIRMVLEVIYGMRVFLLFLLIAIFAFSDAFLSLSLESGDQAFAGEGLASAVLYTYRLTLGDF